MWLAENAAPMVYIAGIWAITLWAKKQIEDYDKGEA